jgi:hypothetical protein
MRDYSVTAITMKSHVHMQVVLTPRLLSAIFLDGYNDDSDNSIPTDSGRSGKKNIHVKPQRIFETLGTSSAHVQEMSERRTTEAIMAATMFPTYW